MSPLQALAQLAPLPGVPFPGAATVSITSPPLGARVSGTIAVPASATTPLGVAGVQFLLDGVNLGTEDTTAPYSVSWDTNAASEGWHTLTAVARDALGTRYKSDPVTVTVSNTPPPPQALKRYEETDASVTFTAGWQSDSGWPWSGGTTAHSRAPGARATFNFTGTSVTWISYRSTYGGIARVFVDGVYVSAVDLFARASNELRVPAFTMSGLTNSSHTITIEVTGLKNTDAVDTLVVVDAFDVPGPPVSRLQESDPFITYTAGWDQDQGTRSWSGDFATVSTTPGAQATLTFSGTSIDWIGYRGPESGIARVFLDGSFVGEIDTYSPTQSIVDALFTATGLADSSHTLTIEVTGLKNDASTGALIVVDGFDVTTLGTRFEESDWSVAYTGNWNRKNQNHAWSHGTVATSNAPGSQATFTFTGTSVSWIGRRGPGDAIARVYLDGAFVADVDNYAPTEGLQDTLFTATGLVYGSHTLTIEVTGRANPATTLAYPWVIVDAFDVRQ
ncbi:MAG: Ig-like domain-containing protein [Gammaproteobacteria bacterium]